MTRSNRSPLTGGAIPKTPVARLSPYRSVSPHGRFLAGSGDALKLDWNESAVGPSPLVLARLSAFVATEPLNWYADPSAAALRRRLAAYTGRPASEILVFNGSDSALDCVARTYVGPGDHVVVCAPCYDNFRVFVDGVGADVEHVLGPSPFASNVKGLVARVRATTRLVYLCNPNNPTGRLYTVRQIERILESVTGGVLVVDEAYYEFTGTTAAGLLDRYENLIVTRSFSKAFGLAGLRCGYAMARARVMRYLGRLRNGKDVSAIAQVASLAALEDLAYMRACVAEVGRARRWLAAALRVRGYVVVPSRANFVLVRVASPARL
ncbi:MAG: histidinol-phosphate aminotransferase family protein, partial [Acidobacteria bacterium]|nr:histidinol-phosphate aminotransferase family protein [Acidobacteriota bacterium]